MTHQCTVDVWSIDLNPPTELIDQLRSILTADEIQRVQRLRFPEHQRRTLVALAQRRLILATYLKIPADQIQFSIGPYGKPFIANADWHFNLSHSNEIALLALCQEAELGIDIEYWRPKIDIDGLITRVFSEHEQQQFQQLPRSQHPASFYQAWTSKEAFVKAVGAGLHYPLPAIEVEVNPTLPARLIKATQEDINLDNYVIQSLIVPVNYTAHLVATAKKIELNIQIKHNVI